jgi:hypothetical protein
MEGAAGRFAPEILADAPAILEQEERVYRDRNCLLKGIPKLITYFERINHVNLQAICAA